MLFVHCAVSRVRRCDLAGRTGSGHHFRQSEVQNLGVSALGHKDVGGLDVAVDDASSVSGIERVGYVDGDGEKNFCFQRTPRDSVLQRDAVQKLHGDERTALLLANVVNCADVGVVQCGRGLCFTLKAGQRLRVSGDFIGQEFQGDKSAQPVSSAL